MTFAEKPVKLTRTLYFSTPEYVSRDPDKYRDPSGYVGHYIFSVPGNTMKSLGYANNSANSRLRLYEVKTTVDWVFDNADMTVYRGNDARWDLCGSKQRVYGIIQGVFGNVAAFGAGIPGMAESERLLDLCRNRP